MAEESKCLATETAWYSHFDRKDHTNYIIDEMRDNKRESRENFQDAHLERTKDGLGWKIENVKDSTAAQMAALSNQLGECCCNGRVDRAEMNGKLDLYAATTNAKIDQQTLSFQNMMKDQEIARLRDENMKCYMSNQMVHRGLFPVGNPVCPEAPATA